MMAFSGEEFMERVGNGRCDFVYGSYVEFRSICNGSVEELGNNDSTSRSLWI